jgi:oxygen-independent coproporphyrinogen-3 oxidase
VWQGHDYLGLGIGAVSTVGEMRWRNAPSLPRYLAALAAGVRPAREVESVPAPVRASERVMLGLRLDEPLALAEVSGSLDPAALERLERLGLAVSGTDTLTLTRRGRFLGDGVTAALLA